MATTPKNTRKPVRQVKTDPGTATTPTQPPAFIPHYFNPNETSQTHELVIEAVATMLSRDSDSRDVDMLLTAAMRHIRRRTYSDLTDDQSEIDARAEEFVQKDFADWKADVVAEWRKNRTTPEAESSSLDTITAKLRENSRQVVIGSFEAFLSQASPEEIRFLREVFMNCENQRLAAEHKHAEIYIASAFEMELTNGRYLQVPARLVKQVERYIDALRAVEGKELA